MFKLRNKRCMAIVLVVAMIVSTVLSTFAAVPNEALKYPERVTTQKSTQDELNIENIELQTTGPALVTTGPVLKTILPEVQSDFTELKALILKAEEIDKTLYTEKSIKALEVILEKTKNLENQKEILQADIDKIVGELQEALNHLALKQKKEAIFVIERATLGQPYYIEPTVVEFTEGENVAQGLVRLLGRENYQCTGTAESGFYLSQVKLKDKLPVNIPLHIKDFMSSQGCNDIEENDDEWLGEFDHTFMSGWIYWLNHEHMPVGMSSPKLQQGDVVRLQFTVWGYGSDLGQGSWDPNKPDYTVANKDGLIRALAYINQDQSAIAENDDLKQAYDEANKVMMDMLASQETVDGAEKALKVARVVNKEALQKAILEAEKLDKSLYTEESIGILETELIKAKEADKENSITQNKVNERARALEKALLALAFKPVDYKTALSTTLEFMYKNNPQLDYGTFSGEWTMLSLARGGYPYPKDYASTYYNHVAKKVESKKGKLHPAKYTEYSRVILGLTAIGKDVRDVAGYNMLEHLADFNKVKYQGINGPIFALLAFDTHHYEIPEKVQGNVQTTRELLIKYILDEEIPGGGFALMGNKPDSDITGMALQALAPYKEQREVGEAIERALNVLSQKQAVTGDFISFEGVPTSESTAQVIVALCALGINPETDVRFIKNDHNAIDGLLEFYVPGGGFKHLKHMSLDAMATDQGAYALAAYDRFVKGQTSLYDMSDVEITYSDKTALQKLIQEATKKDAREYIKESWEAFQLEVTKAVALDKDIYAKQSIVDKEVISLKEALKELVAKPTIKIDVKESKVKIDDSLGEANYELRIKKDTPNVEISIAEDNKSKVTLKVEESLLLPIIEVNKGACCVRFSKGTQIVEGKKEIELFIEKTKDEKEAILQKLKTSLGTHVKELTLETICKLGTDEPIVFNEYVEFIFKGLAGKEAKYIDERYQVHEITRVVNDEEGLKRGKAEYAYDQDENLIIKTKHFTDFLVYEVKKQEQGESKPSEPITEKHVTLSIDKQTIKKGYVMKPTSCVFHEGENVWDVIQREMDKRNIAYEYEWTAKYNSVYIQSIAGDGEFDHGRWSGWMYNVNGWYPNYGASKYKLRDGDIIEWCYTTDLGDDLGIDNSKWNQWPDGTPKNPNAMPGGGAEGLTPVPKPITDKEKEVVIIDGVRVPKEKLKTFEDVSQISRWAKEAVDLASALELVEGYKGYFNPQNPVTRAEFIKMIVSALDMKIKQNYHLEYTDVKAEDWYAPYLQTAFEDGILTINQGEFKPDEAINREEMAVILEKALKLQDKNSDEIITDIETVTPQNRKSIQKVYAYNLIKGYNGKFNPKETLTKEMATAVVVRAYKVQHNIEASEVKSEVKKALDETTDYLVNTVKEPVIGSIGGEWAVFGLARRGAKVPDGYYEDYYQKVVSHAKGQEKATTRKWKTKVTETQRVSIALAAIGKDPTNVEGINLVDYSWNKGKNMPSLSPNDQILGNRQGLNELVFGLITVDLKAYEQPKDAAITRKQIIDKILRTYRTPDGGFNLMQGAGKVDVDMTAMTLQALAPYYGVKDYEEVTKAVNEALDTLSKVQVANGGFENDYGGADGKTASTSESTSQVVVALCALHINPDVDKRFIKNGQSPIDDLMSYYVKGGGFKHLKEADLDQMATEQAYYALVAYERYLNGQTPIYDMSR